MKLETVRVRLTEKEKDIIKMAAVENQMTMSQYILYCTVINPPQIKPIKKNDCF